MPRKPSKRPKKAPKRRSISKMIREADKYCSLYVRQSRADSEGMVVSYTDPTYKAHWKKLHNGHYIPRQYKSVRWDLDNLRPQSYADNMFYGGKPHLFRENLVNEIGVARVQLLEARAKELIKLTPEYLQGIIDNFKTLLQSLNETSP